MIDISQNKDINIPIPEEVTKWILKKSKNLCRFTKKTEDILAVSISHEVYSIAALLACKEIAEDVYKNMKYEMDLALSVDPRLEVYHDSLEKVWMKFIADWQPGQINSGLGQVLQNKFDQLLSQRNV